MSRVGIAHHHSAITVGGAHPTATFAWTFVSQRLMTVHPKMPSLTHPHPFDFSQGRPDPPLEGEGNSLSLRERVRVRVGIFIPLCEPQGLMTVHPESSNSLLINQTASHLLNSQPVNLSDQRAILQHSSSLN